MNHTPRLLEHAGRYAEVFRQAPPTAQPALGVTIVACMDARINPFALFGLKEGDAHIVRNAGGTVTDDTLRSLVISQRFLKTREIILVHHTGCGMLGFSDEEFADQMERETGTRPPWPALAFADPADDVRASAKRIRECPWIPNRDDVRGFVFRVEDGVLEEVEL
jgi:carbonic anhydrase